MILYNIILYIALFGGAVFLTSILNGVYKNNKFINNFGYERNS